MRILFAALLVSLCATSAMAAKGVSPTEPIPFGARCITHERWQTEQGSMSATPYSSAGACTFLGDCDNPNTRDLHLIEFTSPVLTISLQMNILCADDGSSCHADEQDVENAIETLRDDFRGMFGGSAESRIEFRYRLRFINDSTYLQLTNLLGPNPDDWPMKELYATSPGSLLNVWVTGFPGTGFRGFATYPWSPLAVDPRGGAMVEAATFLDPDSHTLTHEVGHALGLWHTFRGGSAEVTQCGACWESPHVANPNPGADVEGDFASDTRATPPNFTCGPPAGNDPCTGINWGSFAPDRTNFMGGAPASEGVCPRSTFTPQQVARMRCWLQSSPVAGWLTDESDLCEDAQLIDPGVYYGTTRGAGHEGGDASCLITGLDTIDVFYYFIPTTSGPITLSMCGSSEQMDSLISVFTDCDDQANTELGCNDDYPECGATSAQARMTFVAVEGSLYVIRVTHGGSTGPNDYELVVCEGTDLECDPPGEGVEEAPRPPIPL